MGLIGNLLDVHRIERGEMNLNIRTSMSAKQSLKSFARCSHTSQKRIAMNAHAVGPVHACAAHFLLQVLENLVSNSLKFSPPGSAVEMTAALCGERVHLEVRRPRSGYFASRPAKSSSAALRGCPPVRPEAKPPPVLGLSIAKKLIEAMHGEIGCDSDLGKGATFWIELPR
ncbi:MAG: ATP-binding protein [Aquabacterium sp.]